MNAMEATFTLKDVIYLVVLIISGLTAWFKMQRDKDKLEGAVANLKERMAGLSASKKALKEEILKTIVDKDLVLHDRINKTQNDVKENMSKVEVDFKEINSKLSNIDCNIGKILGKIGLN